MNEKGCKQYGIKCDGKNKSVKFNKEKIKFIDSKRPPILLRKPNIITSNFWTNFKATEMYNGEHFNDWERAKNSFLSKTSKHKEIFTSGDLPKYYRAESKYLTLKPANEGFFPIELIKSKFNGTIRLPLNDKNIKDNSIKNKVDDKKVEGN
ncbi:hypothetical protein ACQ4LE_001364 [Meloidogyne hapla]